MASSEVAIGEPALGLRDVHVHYGQSHVVQGVDLDVAPGTTMALLGRNGMGKTTLIRAIMNMTAPSAGRIVHLGHDLSGLPTSRVARTRIALVPQGRRVFSTLTVRENLALPASRLAGGGAPREWTLEHIYDLFPRLRERTGQFAGSLSGGEQSMLAFGRALMGDPRTILMDEPTEGLAPVIVRQIEEIVGRLRAAGMTILLVEQNARFAGRIADEVAILSNGRIAWRGTPATLKADAEARTRWLGL